MIQGALLPFAFAALQVGEGLLTLKLSLSDSEKETEELTAALGRNHDSQSRIIQQMNVVSTGLLTLGDSEAMAAEEALVLER
jgi:hypothetical protein